MSTENLNIACPQCGARAGRACTSYSMWGSTETLRVHSQRAAAYRVATGAPDPATAPGSAAAAVADIRATRDRLAASPAASIHQIAEAFDRHMADRRVTVRQALARALRSAVSGAGAETYDERRLYRVWLLCALDSLDALKGHEGRWLQRVTPEERAALAEVTA